MVNTSQGYLLSPKPIYRTKLREQEYQDFANQQAKDFEKRFQVDTNQRTGVFEAEAGLRTKYFTAKEKIRRQIEAGSDVGVMKPVMARRESSFNNLQQAQVNDFNKTTSVLFESGKSKTQSDIDSARSRFEYQEIAGYYTEIGQNKNGVYEVLGYSDKGVDQLYNEYQAQIKSIEQPASIGQPEFIKLDKTSGGTFLDPFGKTFVSSKTEKQLNDELGIDPRDNNSLRNALYGEFLPGSFPFADTLSKNKAYVGRYVKIANVGDSDNTLIDRRAGLIRYQAKDAFATSFYTKPVLFDYTTTPSITTSFEKQYSPLELEYYEPFNKDFVNASRQTGVNFSRGDYVGGLSSGAYAFLSGVKGAGELLSYSSSRASREISFFDTRYDSSSKASSTLQFVTKGSYNVLRGTAKASLGFLGGSVGGVSSFSAGLTRDAPMLIGGALAYAPSFFNQAYSNPIGTASKVGTKSMALGGAILNSEFERFGQDPVYYGGEFVGQSFYFGAELRGLGMVGSAVKTKAVIGFEKLSKVGNYSLKNLTSSKAYNKLVATGKGSPIVGNTSTILKQATSGPTAKELRNILYQTTGGDVPKYSSRAVFKSTGLTIPSSKTVSQFLYKAKNIEKFVTSKAPKGYRLVERYPQLAQMKFVDKLLGKTPGGFKKQYFDVTRNLPLFTKGTLNSQNNLIKELFGRVKKTVLPKQTFYEPGGSYVGTNVSTFMFQGQQKTEYTLFGLGSKSLRKAPGVEVYGMLGKQAKVTRLKGQAVVKAIAKREAELGFDPSKIGQAAVDFRTNKLLRGGRPPKVGPSPKGVPTYRGLFGKATEKAFNIPKKGLNVAEQSPMVQYGLTSEIDAQLKYFSRQLKFAYGNLGQKVVGYTAKATVTTQAGQKISLPIRYYVADVAANKLLMKTGLVGSTQSFLGSVGEKFSSLGRSVEFKYLSLSGVNFRSYYAGRSVIKPLFSPSYIGASVVSSYVNPRTGAGKYVKSTYYPGKTSYKPSYPTYTPSKYPTFTTPTYQPIKYPDPSKVVYPNYTPPKYPYYPISTYPTYTPPTPINYTPPTYPTYPTITYPIYYPPKTPTLKKTEQRKERANTKYEKRVAKAFTQSKTKLFKMPDVSNILLPIKTDWLKSFGSVKQQRYPKVKTIKLTPNERKENKKIARLLGFKFDRLF